MINEKYAKVYCCDDISKIENYTLAIADTTQTWDCHHRLEIQGPFTNSVELLKKCGLYEQVPAWQLIFLTRADHKRLHNFKNTYMLGKHHSEETKKKMRKPKSEETKQKMSEAQRGNTKMLGKILSQATKEKMSVAKLGENNPAYGKHWWNNGLMNMRAEECPGPEWVCGMIRKSSTTQQ